MRKYLTKHKLVLLIAVCLVLVVALTGCSGKADNYTKPFNEWSEESVIWGKFFLWPIAWVMHFIGSLFKTGTFAWGLLFTTIIVRSIAWPIYAKSNDMSLKMQVAQPEIERLQQKYANRKDPQSQQRQQQEMMAIYKKHKINPLGCLMPFLQMPIFMAMYTVVRRIPYGTITKVAEDGTETIINAKLALTDSSFLGIADCLSKGVYGGTDNAALWSAPFWVGIVLALIVGGTMWLLNHISQKQPAYVKKKPNQNQQGNQMASTMKIMNYMMIFMMVFMSLSNNGLALYWVIGNVYSIGQTLLNRKLNEKKFYKMQNEIDVLI